MGKFSDGVGLGCGLAVGWILGGLLVSAALVVGCVTIVGGLAGVGSQMAPPSPRPAERNQAKEEAAPPIALQDTDRGPEPLRTWTDKSGRRSVTAKFTREENGVVFLTRADGSQAKIERAALSPSDQAYLRSRE